MISYLWSGLRWVTVDYFRSICDPRVEDYFVVRYGFIPTFIVLALYYYASLSFGPRFMANRKPYKLKRAMLVYNVALALINFYCTIETIYETNWFVELFNFRAPDPTDRSPREMMRAFKGFLYLGTKYLDLVDTAFFILRKKWSHITFLHVYHHSTVAFLATFMFNVHPTATVSGVFTFCNSFVHMVMYSYYALATLGPAVRPYLWWKRYITQLQIAQFIIYCVYTIVFFSRQEGYNMAIAYIAAFQSPLYIYLFGKFYFDTYLRKQKSIDCDLHLDHNGNSKKLA